MRKRPNLKDLLEVGHALDAIAAFDAKYHNRPSRHLVAGDAEMIFREALDRYSGRREARTQFRVTCASKRCAEKFTIALPGSHVLADSEGGHLRSARLRSVRCPHCNAKQSVAPPEGLAVVRADGEEEGHGGGTGRQGKDGALGMGKDRAPTGSELGEESEDGGDGEDKDDDEDALRAFMAHMGYATDDDEDKDDDEDEEEGEGGVSSSGGRDSYPPARQYRDDTGGHGVRDSAKRFYDSARGRRRVAAEAAIAAFRATLREINRFSRPVQ